MSKLLPQHPRILAVTTSTKGIGFAVLEEQEMLVDWGTKPATGNKNVQCVNHTQNLIIHYQPDVLVLEEMTAARSRRIRSLNRQLVGLGKKSGIAIQLFSREQVYQLLLGTKDGTKHALASFIAERFSDELGSRLPPKRKPWMSEDARMDMFLAVGLALVKSKSTY